MTHTDRRNRLPNERPGTVHRFVIGDRRFFLRTSTYADGRLGEIFIDGGSMVAEEQEETGDIDTGSTSAWADAFAAAVSIGLQYGAPVEVFADKFQYTSFEPRGATDNASIPRSSSVVDYVFRYLRSRFGNCGVGEGESNSGLSVERRPTGDH